MTKTAHNPPPLSPARQVLAESIEEVDAARKALVEAQEAEQRARRKSYIARDALDESQKDAAEAEPSELAAAVIANPNCDVSLLERPARRRELAIEQTRNELDLWTRATEACQAAVAQRQRSVETAQRRVTQAVTAVVRESVAIDQRIEELLKRQERLDDEAATLHVIIAAASDAMSSDRQECRRRDLAMLRVGTTSVQGNPSGFLSAQRWTTALEELQRDANSPLPD